MTHVYLLNWAGTATVQIQMLWKAEHACDRWLGKPAQVARSLHALAFVLSTWSKTSVSATEQLMFSGWRLTWIWFELVTIAPEHFPLYSSASYKSKLTWGQFQKRNNIHFPKRGCFWGFTASLSSFTPDWIVLLVCCRGNVSYLCIPL